MSANVCGWCEPVFDKARRWRALPPLPQKVPLRPAHQPVGSRHEG